jgi:NADH:ubiquinone oxidoreductase subunit 6 (subunit J)
MLSLALFSILALQGVALCGTTSVFMAVMHTVILFCTASGVLLALGYEFMAIINVLIYVGALAVLFLFVVMLINVPASTLSYYTIGIGALATLGVVNTRLVATVTGGDYAGVYGAIYTSESLAHIGQALYVYYGDILVLNSIVLTVALLGALTIAHTRA